MAERNWRRKIVLALLTAISLRSSGASFAQVCSPVPALPDSERRTQYSITAQTGPFAVGFAVYGDNTDYGDWIGVYVNERVQSGSICTITRSTAPCAPKASRPMRSAACV
jgi:hypothetical protein